MLNMNEVRLLGYAGRDPEVREGKGGERVVRFTLATTRRWRTKAGEADEATQWHRVVAFGQAAAAAERFVHKGAALLIEGRIEYRAYEDEEGVSQPVTEIVVAGSRALINGLGPAPAGTPEAEVQAGETGDAADG